MRAKYTHRTNLSGSYFGYFAPSGDICCALLKGESSMKRVSFIRQSKLTNVRGRIDYISNPERQENLYATYSTVPDQYWRDLARENREDFKRSGTEGRCIEARELIIALPPTFINYDHDELLRMFVESYKAKYDVECTAALHHNKTRNNLHIHLIYSERKELAEPEVKIATRNMYYDQHGKHVRTKKEITDEHGKLLPGCRVVKKGEIYEQHHFEKKRHIFKSAGFLDDVKVFMTNIINLQLPEQSRMIVFPKNSPYLPTKKIGKNNPKEAEIKEDNLITDEWNKGILQAMEMRVPKQSLLEVKRQLITQPVRESITRSNGKKNPISFRSILGKAVNTLNFMLRQRRYMSRDDWMKAWGEALGEFIKECIKLATGTRLSSREHSEHFNKR